LALAIRIDARTTATGRGLVGTIQADEGVDLADPLASLAVPAGDRERLRTWPVAPSTARLTWRATPGLGANTWTFEAELPERYGATGWTARGGLRADGTWYPRPVDAGGIPLVATWDVTVRAARAETVIVNGAVGTAEARWRGEADRIGLAVTRAPAIEQGRLTGTGLRGRQPAMVTRAVTDWPLPSPPRVALVVTEDYQRLATAAPGLVFLSHRAFRVTGGLVAYHLPAVRRAILAAAAPLSRDWDRRFVASALLDGAGRPSVRKLLGWAAWNPIVDQLLYDGTLPYYAEIFDEVSEQPPGATGMPPRAAVAQLDDLRGPGAAEGLARLMLTGMSREDAASSLALPPAVVAGWGVAWPRGTDYRATRRAVERSAPPDAPAEVVIVEVDGQKRAWEAGPGPSSLPIEAGAGRVRADPAAHADDADRSNDRWPATWTTVASGWIDDVDLTGRTFSLWADLAFRRRNDTRNVFLLDVAHDARDLAAVGAGWVHALGPLVDRRRRTQRLYLLAGPSVLDPAYRPTPFGSVAVGSTLGWTWDTRDSDTTAMHGHRLGAALGAGFVPGSDERWASAGGGSTLLVPLHQRHVVALRGSAGWASGEVEHRLLSLGGADAVRSLPAGAVVGNERLLAMTEYRWAVLRHGSVPLPLAWLDELQLAPGVEAGTTWLGGEAMTALGARFGVYGIGDLLGARPTLVGLDAAWLLAGPRPPTLQVYLDFDHGF
jgi:hypothetical protein